MNKKWLLSIVLPSFFLLLIQAAFVPQSFAQETASPKNVLRGTVQNSKGQPLQNVSVLIKGKGTGTQTDRKGTFRLEVQPDDVLEFSIVGYITQEQSVSGKAALQVTLQESAGNLDQIVVTGYSSQRRKDCCPANHSRLMEGPWTHAWTGPWEDGVSLTWIGDPCPGLTGSATRPLPGHT